MSFLNPEKIISTLPISGNMSVADFGCGSGGWSIPLAKKVKDGQVYAVDVTEEALSALKSKISSERVANIKVVRADLEKSSGLRDEFIDFVVVSNLLFQTENKNSIIKEAHRIIKKGGMLLIAEWLPGTDNGPTDRISPEETKQIVEDQGFKIKKEVDAGVYHYAHLYEKI